MPVDKKDLMRKLRRLAASCDPSTPEREFAVRAFMWIRSRMLRLPPPISLDTDLVERPRGDQDDAPAQVTSVAQARTIFNNILQDEVFSKE